MQFLTNAEMTSILSIILLSLTSCAARHYVIKADRRTSDITCWTCPYKSNNEECNNWAPDTACPLDNTVCRTIHRVDKHTGRSVSVIKQCAPPTKCDSDHVGCRHIGNTNHLECVSCCSFSYCNSDVPVNHTTALRLSVSMFNNASSRMSAITAWLSPLMIILLGYQDILPLWRR